MSISQTDDRQFYSYARDRYKKTEARTDLLAALRASPCQRSTTLFFVKQKHISLIPIFNNAVVGVWATPNAQIPFRRVGGAVVVVVVIVSALEGSAALTLLLREVHRGLR